MDAVVAVRGLGVRSVKVVRRIRHVAVCGSLVRLPGPSPAQPLVCMVEPAPHHGKAPASGVVERAGGLCLPEAVLLAHQLLDLLQDRLFVHVARITGQPRASALPRCVPFQAFW